MAAKRKNNVATVDEPMALAPVIDYGDDFGSGLDDVGQDEAGIPFLKILQVASPEVVGPAGKIEGAVAGDIVNTSIQQVTKSVMVVPAVRQHVFVEWRPRSVGGGIAGVHEPGSDVVRKAKEDAAAAGREFFQLTVPTETDTPNDLVETYYLYAVVLDEAQNPEGFVVIPFTGTAIPQYKKQFMRRAKYCLVDDGNGRKRNPPLFAHSLNVTTFLDGNKKGNWFNYNLAFAVSDNVRESLLTPGSAAYQAGKDLSSLVKSGQARADMSNAATASGDDAGDDGSAF